MKLASNTLYQQWRNITTMCPGRCDPTWIDLNITLLMAGEFRDTVEAAQAAPTATPYGYDTFAARMAELAAAPDIGVVPLLGAGHLQMRYQELPVQYDYYIVPKLSRVSASLACPDVDFHTIKPRYRFTPRTMARTMRRFSVDGIRQGLDNEGDEYHRLQREYDTEPPTPEGRLSRRRRGTAEHEWLDLNLLANYEFTKNSVQLLYGPIDGPYYEPALHNLMAGDTVNDEMEEALSTEGNVSRRVGSVHATETIRHYSEQVTINSQVIAAEAVSDSLKALRLITIQGMTPEAETDAISGRKLIEDPDITRARLEHTSDILEEAAANPRANFIFTQHYPTALRHPNPTHFSRNADRNPNYLFVCAAEYRPDFDPIKEWTVPVYDIGTGEFIHRTLPEWEAECAIDDIALMPLEYMPALLERGVSADDIIYLSTQVTAATPVEQVEGIFNGFLEARGGG